MAVSRWGVHRNRIADFIERRGRGTENYGWKAWEARWSLVMANLMERMNIQGLQSPKVIYLEPEKGIPRDRLYPWELMHHTGYWYRQAARHTAQRRALAYSMPEEDRRSPSTAPETNATNNAYTYDTYLCPEPHEERPLDKPGVDYSGLIIDYLAIARTQFQDRGQHRLAAEITLDCAKEATNLEQWDDVTALLLPIWEDMPFRQEGWADITEDISWTLRPAAAKKGLGDVVLTIDWELLHRSKHYRTNFICLACLTILQSSREERAGITTFPSHWKASTSLQSPQLASRMLIMLRSSHQRSSLGAGRARPGSPPLRN